MHLFPNSELRSVIYMGLCFMVLFSADFTITNMQKTIANSITNDNPGYEVDGYVSLGLSYAVYGVTLWFAPAFISVSGLRIAFVLGSAAYILDICSFLVERTWVTYLGMVIGGIGGSIVWASEGNYLVLSSRRTNLTRNVGIFWALYTCSLIFGNIYAVVEFEGKTTIDRETRVRLLIALGGLAVLATLMFCLVPSATGNRFTALEQVKKLGPLEALTKTWTIFTRREILILVISFVYVGLQQSFGQGIYAPCLGFTKQFGNEAKQLVPMSGLLYGCGDLLGGLVQSLGSKWVKQVTWWPTSTILAGFFLQLIAYVLIALNIPNNAVFGETSDSAVFAKSSIPVAILCSFLIGFGDSCINTQMYPLLAALEPDFSAQTSALYKFTKSMAMAVCFFCSPYLGLHIQLSIIIIFGLVGTTAFVYVDRQVRRLDCSPDS